MKKRTWAIALVAVAVIVVLVGAYAAGWGMHQADQVPNAPHQDNGSSGAATGGTTTVNQTSNESSMTASGNSTTSDSTDGETASSGPTTSLTSSNSTTPNNSTGPQAPDTVTTPKQTVDDVTIARYANAAYMMTSAGDEVPNETLASTIIVSGGTEDFAPGTVDDRGGVFMQNDTWYPFTVTETVVGTAYSGQVWDVVCLGYSGYLSNFVFQQKSDGAWETVQPIDVDSGSYCVLDPWNTTDGTHSLELRYMYTGPDIEYKADLVTMASDGGVVGDEFMTPDSKFGGLFTANIID